MGSPTATIEHVATHEVPIEFDEKVLAELRERVGPQELSSYINDLVRRNLQWDRIDVFLRELDERHGPVPQEMIEEAQRILRGE